MMTELYPVQDAHRHVIPRSVDVMKRPGSVTIVVVLQWIAATVGVISGLDLISSALHMTDLNLATEIEATLVANGVVDVNGGALLQSMLVAGILTLVIAFIRVMVAVYLARGRAWARMILAIVAGLNLLGALGYLLHGEWWRATVVVVVELVILGLLFNTKATAFIREQERVLVS